MRSLAISLMPSHRRGRTEMEDRLSIDPSEGEQKMTKVHEYFSTIEEVGATTFSSTFNLQIAHIAKNCLQRRHPELPTHTSGNEELAQATW